MKSILLIWFSFVTVVNTQSPCDEAPFVDRAGWGAAAPIAITNLTDKPLSFYIIHHSESPGSCYDDATCIERVKSIQYFHQHTRGWDDIGYHFLVGENGKIYEGRGWDRQGAHSPGWNNAAYGICIIGNFSVDPPNEKALNVLNLWIECGVKRDYVKENYIITHRQSQRPGYTDCPGDALFDQVKTWPRFCPFQNSGMNLTQNETEPSIAREFCAKNIGPTSTSPIAPYLFIPIITFHLFLIYFFKN